MSSILSETFDQSITLEQACCWVSVVIFNHAGAQKKNEYAWPIAWTCSYVSPEIGDQFINSISQQESSLRSTVLKFHIDDAKEKIKKLVDDLFECEVVRCSMCGLGYDNFLFTTKENLPLILICYGSK